MNNETQGVKIYILIATYPNSHLDMLTPFFDTRQNKHQEKKGFVNLEGSSGLGKEIGWWFVAYQRFY